MPESGTLLGLRDIHFRQDGRVILQGIDLCVRTGEIVTLIGPNGAGKTTLIRIALGLLAANDGEVWRQAGLCIGYMPQRLHIDSTFPLSVRRFLAMAGNGRATAGEALLGEVGALHVIDSRLQEISGGELQRVLLARALLRNPQLLVLDEPVQGVDVHGQIELYRLIAGIREQRGCAVLMVSHDLHLVMAATDRVLCLNRHICCSGTPEAVTSDPAYLELFGAQAAPDLALYSHDRSHRHDVCTDCVEGRHAR
ncbi:MAG: metal ABC transporter ATP-binding protein [Desulfuromonadales bacterium]|nr:metal ABC transporter ATP-binding protein [Desulfuromonadales bacterium]